MKKKQTNATKNEAKAEKALNEFLKHLEKNGFTESIKKFLNLAWQETKYKEIYENMTSLLKDIKFKTGDFKLIAYDRKYRMYRFRGLINGRSVSVFVQPLDKDLTPDDNGFYGVIPSKLSIFKEAPQPTEYKTDVKDDNKDDNDEINSEQGQSTDGQESALKSSKKGYNEKTTPFSEKDKEKIKRGEQPDGK